MSPAPAEKALLPRLVGEERLVTANALNSSNNNLGRLAGPAAGAVIAVVAARRTSGPVRGLSDLGIANAANLVPPRAVEISVAMGFMFAAGFPVVAMNAAGNGLLQTHAADSYRGRVFGAYMATVSVATLIGLGIGGPAADAAGVVSVLSVGAVMWMIGGLLALGLIPRAAPTTSERQDHDQV